MSNVDGQVGAADHDNHDAADETTALLHAAVDDDDQPTVTRRELWSYYLYYNGDNGVSPQSYSLAIFQSVLTAAGHDPTIFPPQAGNCTTGPCVIPWGSSSHNVSSILLLANGFCFTVMTAMFLCLGSAADYGSLGPKLLLYLTITCWIAQYSFMAVTDASQWPLAMLLYTTSYITYGATLVFYAAIFPRLARYTPSVRHARSTLLPASQITLHDYNTLESLSRSHISNISTAHSNIGYLLVLLLNLTILIPLSSHPYANNLALLLTTTYFLLLGLPWFIFQQPRPGPALPKPTSYLRATISHLSLALRSAKHLPQTFLYLSSFFLLSDGLNTTSTLISILQNDTIHFSFLHLTYLGLSQALTSTVSTLAFDWVQRRFCVPPKRLFQVTNLFSVLIPAYGCLALSPSAVGRPGMGYTTLASFVLYNILFGLFQAPYYAYSQTLMAELTPRGYEGVFFGLFGTMNRASSVVGPNVLFAITEGTGRREWGFVFLTGLTALASLVICVVDVDKGRQDCRRFVGEKVGDGHVQAGEADESEIHAEIG
ncbi:autophagy-related protein 22-like protein [Elsinoe ampelina]|uniref:Autophagy-related protein n=1 Tax=Elsinoe ampelina TaxID=302913 RepID=A0A6A6GKB0_9PEZI|nr:autophagy-related protein 22-like protein [Elsinoe ampelina]